MSALYLRTLQKLALCLCPPNWVVVGGPFPSPLLMARGLTHLSPCPLGWLQRIAPLPFSKLAHNAKLAFSILHRV